MNKPMRATAARAVSKVITEEWGLYWNNIKLVGNGSAGVNHLPVTLWLQRTHVKSPPVGLKLVLAAPWDLDKQCYSVACGFTGTKLNASHHLSITRVHESNTLAQIGRAIDDYATVIVCDSFPDRNRTVARLADRIIYLPMNEDDPNNHRYGQREYDAFDGPKHRVCLSQISVAH